MRYYVLCFSQAAEIAPFIVAEVVRDSWDAETAREDSLAGAIAGPRAIIATSDELGADPAGRQALEAWNARDDSEFERETTALSRDEDVEWPELRLVTEHVATDHGPTGPPKPRPLRLPEESERRALIAHARGLRVVARALTQESRARRDAVTARRSAPPHLVGGGPRDV